MRREEGGKGQRRAQGSHSRSFLPRPACHGCALPLPCRLPLAFAQGSGPAPASLFPLTILPFACLALYGLQNVLTFTIVRNPQKGETMGTHRKYLEIAKCSC